MSCFNAKNGFSYLIGTLLGFFMAGNALAQPFQLEYLMSCQSGDIAINGNIAVIAESNIRTVNLETFSHSWLNCSSIHNLAISGDTFVGQTASSNSSDANIISYNLSTNTEIAITAGGYAYNPDIDGDIVVWEDYSSSPDYAIKSYDLKTGITSVISTIIEDNQNAYPKISGNNIVWRSYKNGIPYLELYNIETQVHKTITHISYPWHYDSFFCIDGENIAWFDAVEQYSSLDIFVYNIETERIKNITNSQFEDDVHPYLKGNTVVFYNWMTQTIKGYELETDITYDLCSFGTDYQTSYIYDDKIYCISHSGLFKLTTPSPAAWYCSDAQEVHAGVNAEYIYPFAQEAISSCGYNDIFVRWCKYTPQQSGEVTISTYSQAMDTVLSVYNGCGGVELACNDDTPSPVSQTGSTLTLNVTANKTYFIRTAGFNGGYGAYQLEISPNICSHTLRSDANHDCRVDMLDLAILASEWLTGN
ncbi:MAG: hypothetical protein JW745_05480 [Sedimentisphaerales bacterium]|nr:hypothetical protein [Sedimentisphaerales bacterium]MBN2842615.1 hypothetical protein [Sedimentisphaerales bacterium]